MSAASKDLGIELSKGGKLLDEGLSLNPTDHGQAVKSFWSTRGGRKEIFWATPEELEEIVRTGQNFSEKSQSVANYIANKVNTTNVATVNVGYATANTDVLIVHEHILATGKVQLSLILSEPIVPRKSVNRYSIRACFMPERLLTI